MEPVAAHWGALAAVGALDGDAHVRVRATLRQVAGLDKHLPVHASGLQGRCKAARVMGAA